MKKQMFLFISILIGALVMFSSCEKEEEIDTRDIETEQGTDGTSNSGGGTGGGSDTNGYTITSTSVCAIVAADNSSTGTKYSKSWYKWITSTGRVILSRSKTNSNSWVGVASKSYDSTCKGFSVSSYTYKFVDYSSVGVTWYYYFN